jgi:myosin heavy subunit
MNQIEDKAKASAAWAHLISALKTLGITSQESNALWSVLGAIYHLGVASVSRGNMGKTQFARFSFFL